MNWIAILDKSFLFYPLYSEFLLDPSGGFYDDYVEIYSPDLNGALMGRWYGNTLPTNLTQMQGIWIKFRSNADEFRGQGFRAQWNHGRYHSLSILQ